VRADGDAVLPRAAQGAGGEGDVSRVGAAGEVEQVGEGGEAVGLVVELGGVEVQPHGASLSDREAAADCT
jgi:hypothetical protein